MGLRWSEIYTIHKETVLTIFYSGEGKTRKVIVEPKMAMLHDDFENLLQEIILWAIQKANQFSRSCKSFWWSCSRTLSAG